MIKNLRVPSLFQTVELAYMKVVEPLSGPNFNNGHISSSKVFKFDTAVDTLGFMKYVYFEPGANVCVCKMNFTSPSFTGLSFYNNRVFHIIENALVIIT